ncbi:MAG: helix-hairpin-helix domain-containing protein, partial [Bombilactobacillus mellis]|nr:helix-hairpin-helix domain-containing protein [Bombilactobacillus mellis]
GVFFGNYKWVIKMKQIWQWLKEHIKLVSLVILVTILGLWQLWPAPSVNNDDLTVNSSKTAQKSASKPTKTATSKWLIVDVEGAVNKPGVYRLLTTARVYDAIQHAGGLAEQADTSAINQAQKLHDQSQVFVPDKNNSSTASNTAQTTTANSTTDSKTINLNTADVTELQNLPGVGPKKAELIIQYRQEKGSFSKIEDLTEVQGIGEKTFAKIKSQLTV